MSKDVSYEDDLYGEDDDEEVVTTTKKVIITKVENDDLFGENKGKGVDNAPAHIPTPSTTTTTTTTKVTKSYDDDNGDDFDDYDNDDFDDLDHIEMGEDIVSPTSKVGIRPDNDHVDKEESEDEIAALQRELEELEHQEAILSKELSMR